MDKMTGESAPDELALARQIDRVAHAFEQALRRGESLRIEDLVAEHPHLGVALERELLGTEIDHRLLQAATIDWPAYEAIFPHLASHLGQMRADYEKYFVPGPIETSRLSAQESVAESGVVGDRPATDSGDVPIAPLDLNDYELQSRLGKGGQGDVYLARQRSLGRPVAVKLLKASGDDTLNVQRFLREARTLAQTRHPHIVTIHGIGRLDDGGYFLVMEHVAGADLAKQIRLKQFSPREAVQIVRQIATAIEHAHQRGVIHRDLKPSNVLWDEIRGPVVTDFGLAKDLLAEEDLTVSEQVMGTPAYMAPEQASRRFGPVSAQTDVYGLGATLFALLTGQPPYASGSILEILQQLTGDDPPPDPLALRPEVPPELALLCRRALARQPGQRFASVKEFGEELERWLLGKPLEIAAELAATTTLPPSGERMLGKYRLLMPLSEDGTRCVYKAAAPDGRLVLLKYLPRSWLSDRLKRSQFRQEVLLSSRLKHRCLAPVVEIGEVEDAEFIALDHIEGEAVAAILAREGRLEPRRAIAILQPIAELLHLIHQTGVYYRDLRPQNILITAAGEPMLAEIRFGQELDKEDNVTLGGRGEVTVQYIAPELLVGQSSNVASEVYTLGATLYAMLVGQPPFADATSLLDVMIRKNEGRYPDLREKCPEASDALAELIAAAMNPSPANRHASAELFAQRLAVAQQPQQQDENIAPGQAEDSPNLLHSVWDSLDAELQDAFALAYNKKRRSGSTRISTQDLFQALGRLGTGPMRQVINSLPPGALPEPADPSISTDRTVLRERPLLSDCVHDSLTEFSKAPRGRIKVAPIDLFVDVAKHGHGASVVRLREHGVDPDRVERIVEKLGLKVIRREAFDDRGSEGELRDRVWDDNVQFSVYRPKAIQPEVWERMLVFAHLSELPPNAGPRENDPLEEVRKQAEQVLGERLPAFESRTADGTRAIPRAGELTLVPHGDGLEFNPPSRTFRWLEPVHREEFRFRAAAHLEGQLARGRLSVFLGSILIAEVNLVTRIDRQANLLPEHKLARHNRAFRFRRIYACVAPEDAQIAEQFRRYASTVRDSFLMSQLAAHRGAFDEAEQQVIRSADVFQLYWSTRAMGSRALEQHWRYALSLQRPEFIRSLYWEEPFPRSDLLPPPELMALGFQKIPVQRPPEVAGMSQERFNSQSIEPAIPSKHAAVRIHYGDMKLSAAPVVAQPYLEILSGPDQGRILRLTKERVTIGRHSECDLALNSGGAGRYHAQLYHEEGRWLVEDLHSRNGTFVNGHRAEKRVALRDGDKLHLADVVIAFRDSSKQALSKEQHLEDVELIGTMPEAISCADSVEPFAADEPRAPLRASVPAAPLRPSVEAAQHERAHRPWLPGMLLVAALALVIAVLGWLFGR